MLTLYETRLSFDFVHQNLKNTGVNTDSLQVEVFGEDGPLGQSEGPACRREHDRQRHDLAQAERADAHHGGRGAAQMREAAAVRLLDPVLIRLESDALLIDLCDRSTLLSRLEGKTITQK